MESLRDAGVAPLTTVASEPGTDAFARRPLHREALLLPALRGSAPRSRRHFLHLTAVAAVGALLSACGPAEEENTPMDADEILSAAGFSAPTLETAVTDGMLEDGEEWSKVVTFSGPSEEVEAWIAENFDSGIQSEAYKDDMATAVERLGTGVQKQGDRLTEGVEGSVAFLVVVGQGENPEVHVAVRRTGR